MTTPPQRTSTGSCTDDYGSSGIHGYTSFCEIATAYDEVFANFRRHYQHRMYAGIEMFPLSAPDQIISFQQKILDYIRACDPDILQSMKAFQEADGLGNPILLAGQQTSLVVTRYIKVAMDLRRLFGSLDGFRIAEIGVGWGGQCKIISTLWKPASYSLIDLPEVIGLATKYLKGVDAGAVRGIGNATRGFPPGMGELDLVISNYALTELPLALQTAYYENLIRHSKRVYITDNSTWSSGHLGSEIRDFIPLRLRQDQIPIQFLPDLPDTSAGGNRIVVSGNAQPYFPGVALT
jgi:hypothetical protein